MVHEKATGNKENWKVTMTEMVKNLLQDIALMLTGLGLIKNDL